MRTLKGVEAPDYPETISLSRPTLTLSRGLAGAPNKDPHS